MATSQATRQEHKLLPPHVTETLLAKTLADKEIAKFAKCTEQPLGQSAVSLHCIECFGFNFQRLKWKLWFKETGSNQNISSNKKWFKPKWLRSRVEVSKEARNRLKSRNWLKQKNGSSQSGSRSRVEVSKEAKNRLKSRNWLKQKHGSSQSGSRSRVEVSKKIRNQLKSRNRFNKKWLKSKWPKIRDGSFQENQKPAQIKKLVQQKMAQVKVAQDPGLKFPKKLKKNNTTFFVMQLCNTCVLYDYICI